MTRIGNSGHAVGAYRRASQSSAQSSVQNPVRLETLSKESAAPVTPVADIAALSLPQHLRDAFVALSAEADGLRRALAAARRRIDDLETLVETDTLTPVANRRGLLRDLSRTLAEVKRHGLRAALVFVDVDGLKAINDAHGHAAGDAALVHVARILRAQLRESDSVARLGGDEFVVLLRHVDPRQARAKLDRIVAAVSARPVSAKAASFTVAVSAGLHVLGANETVDGVLGHADRAMYAHKAARTEC